MCRQWCMHINVLLILTLGCGDAEVAVDRDISSSKMSDAVVVDPPAISVGRVDVADRKGQGTCRILNRGAEPLTVQSVVPSCGCSKADLSSDVIPPGGAATMKVSLTSSRAGHKSSRVIVSFRDSPRVVRIPVEGSFVRRFWLDPASIRVRCSSDSTSCSVPIRFFFADSSVAESVDAARIRVVCEETTELTMADMTRHRDYTCLNGTLAMQFAASEEFSTTVRLDGISPEGPITLPVSIQRDLQASGISPKYSAIGNVAAGETRRIQLSGPAVVLKSVSHAEITESVGMECRLERPQGDGELDLIITFRKNCSAGVVQAGLALWNTSGEKVHEMKLFANVVASEPSGSN